MPESQFPEPLPERGPEPAGGRSPRPRGTAGRTILIILLTMTLTFALTVGGAALFLLRQGGGALRTASLEQALGLSLADDPDTRAELAKFRTVYQTLDQNYYRDLTDAEMVAAMTRGLVNEMDSPYTMYLDAAQTKQIAEAMSGNYVGIGAVVSFNASQQVEIVEIIPGSPAERAGLLTGDVFIAVDGHSVESVQDITQVAVLVRGEAGTKVQLEMYRPSARTRLTVEVERQAITSASVSHRMLASTIGYVRITEFSSGVADQFIKAVEDLKAQGATRLVFDLRNNSGGLANEVIDMLDYLLPETTIARIEGRQDGKPFTREWTSDAAMGVPSDMRYAILINEFTASASELFTGCLRDHDLAVVVGEKSFGKGSGTLTFNLPDGSSINVTNFRYYLPAGECIEGQGLMPDQAVELPDSARGKSIPQLTAAEDTQLARALSCLDDAAGNRNPG